MGVEQIGTGGSDGNNFPNTKLAFYGGTPVAQPTITTTTTTATTASNEATINSIIAALCTSLNLAAHSGP